ncbi:Conserved uncharacterized protein [Stigmatella aurantiaca DW4/3-1]|uniref:Conserved uncharacterized protein n=1 Tax=Stigmatella aurantiaca (strain DW4/3-1) TaxID=378806 RepID=E3FXV4_STIAD|nr:Conserved uncharacterized protein [Stigmatella aurantiaca DW4/3-1]
MWCAPSHRLPEHEDATERLSEANRPILSACPTGLRQRPPTGGSPPEAPSFDSRTPLGDGAGRVGRVPLACEGALLPADRVA